MSRSHAPTGPEAALPPAYGADEQIEPEPRSWWQLEFDLIHDDGDWTALDDVDAALADVRQVVANCPELADRPPAVVALALSSDAAVARLNATFRGKPKPTNVLSFPAEPGPSAADAAGTEPRFLGDIVLAAETVVGEAREMAIPLADHVRHLVIHAVLHLAGFDHQTDHDASRMETLETRLLARLGIPDPHADADAAPKTSAHTE